MPSNGSGPLLPTLALIGQVGFVMIACVLAGVLAGRYLDSRLDSSPVLMLVLATAGAAGGMTAVYRLIMKAIADDRSDKDHPCP